MRFHEWLTKKYIEWRGDSIGNERSITEFGKLIGADKSSTTLWMRGKRKPSRESLAKLASALGPEVYTVLGLPVPAAVQPVELDLPLDLPPAFRDLMIAAGNELSAALIANKIDPTSPEGLALADAIMEKHGYKRIVSTNPGKPG